MILLFALLFDNFLSPPFRHAEILRHRFSSPSTCPSCNFKISSFLLVNSALTVSWPLHWPYFSGGAHRSASAETLRFTFPLFPLAPRANFKSPRFYCRILPSLSLGHYSGEGTPIYLVLISSRSPLGPRANFQAPRFSRQILALQSAGIQHPCADLLLA